MAEQEPKPAAAKTEPAAKKEPAAKAAPGETKPAECARRVAAAGKGRAR